MGKPDSVVLLMTHFIDDIILGQYRKLKSDLAASCDVVLLYNLTEEHKPKAVPEDVRCFRFHIDDIAKLDYPAKDMSLSSFNIELFVVNYALAMGGYRWYWPVEYDVRFSGSWQRLIDHFRTSECDLLGTTIFDKTTNPEWENWDSLQSPGGTLAEQDCIRSFLPVYRISARGLQALHAAYKAGWAGHCEATVPTILNLLGMAIEDIGGDGPFVRPENRNRFYLNTPKAWHHGPGTLVFRPVLEKEGDRPNMLWHPVKSRQGMVTGRRNTLIHRAKKLIERLGPSA